MKLYDTLIELLAEARSKDRELRVIDGESDETILRFPELWDRAPPENDHRPLDIILE